MSQHFHETQYRGHPVEVLMGWDRPLQGFFMVVTLKDAAEDEEDLVWSNLMSMPYGQAHPKTLAPFLEVLRDMDIQIPQTMIEEVQADAARNEGNKRVRHP